MIKDFKDEKYIYYLMAYCLAMKKPDKRVSIGIDNGFKGSYRYQRRFYVKDYGLKRIMTETKSSPHYANYSRYVEIINPANPRPTIRPYINEAGEDGYKTWTH